MDPGAGFWGSEKARQFIRVTQRLIRRTLLPFQEEDLGCWDIRRGCRVQLSNSSSVVGRNKLIVCVPPDPAYENPFSWFSLSVSALLSDT